MSQRHLESSSRNSLESCTLQLLSWRPFHGAAPKTLDPSEPQKPFSSTNGFHSTPKRPCLSDRSTSFSIEAISRLSLADDDNCGGGGGKAPASNYKKGSLRLVARKRRRRGSRSVSGRSSDRSANRRCCSVGAHGTCSDFPFTVGTDSSGELFGDVSWASDVSEVRNSGGGGGNGEKEGGGGGFGMGIEPMGSESGYGSEPGYRGDAEFGYGDEFDEEEEDAKLMFWGDSRMEVVGEKEFSDKKAHNRCRRKKHDYRTLDDSMR
ncbi:PREDICTED: SUN domain-containing protein 2-like [Tarenaya hassleriana]|uniref:SUN domain-containing protein 2-like n=1 Tax=Tarenaya hassleriana TaxID=28532 RepID=UPI00053C1386|nr:PREDICTED: SUN domain-containing protein 2-like [Tarenaya hassleriana]